jgi:hypothetical protein
MFLFNQYGGLYEAESIPPIEIARPAPDIIQVIAPYNEYFVRDIKLIPTRRWTGKFWEFSAAYEEDVKRSLEEYFPKPEQRWWFLVEVNSGPKEESHTVDGIRIVSFSRDWAKAYNKSYPHVEIYYQKLGYGGSRRRPYWQGKLVYGLWHRRKAIFEFPSTPPELIIHYNAQEPYSPSLVRDIVRRAEGREV